MQSEPPNYGRHGSHLILIDVDLDSAKLRARHPDRKTILILPAVVAATLNSFPYPGLKPNDASRIAGHIRRMPYSIHVPRPFNDGFHRLDRVRSQAINGNLIYRVSLRYGSSLEPWVTGVEFIDAH
jgi:hypothetical protein